MNLGLDVECCNYCGQHCRWAFIDIACYGPSLGFVWYLYETVFTQCRKLICGHDFFLNCPLRYHEHTQSRNHHIIHFYDRLGCLSPHKFHIDIKCNLLPAANQVHALNDYCFTVWEGEFPGGFVNKLIGLEVGHISWTYTIQKSPYYSLLW